MSDPLEKANLSPIRTGKTNHLNAVSPFGLLASPLSNIDLMSPQSTLSFSLSSPPPSNTFKASEIHSTSKDMLCANISPSIFSPEDHHIAVRFLCRDKDSQFSTISLFDEMKAPLFPKEVILDKKSQKKSIRLKERRDASIEKEDLGASSVETKDKVLPKISKARKCAMKITPETPDSEEIVSPNYDIARRLSLESNSELVPQSSLHPNGSGAKLVGSASKKLSSSATKLSPSRTSCNCKKSRCLKLYCDCFAALKYCDSTYCNCVQCCNNVDNEDKRSEAVKSTKEKNLLAFQTKISDQDQHVTGCHCKNSHCLKKYCECFTGGALCGANCKCQSCKNYDGSVELLKTKEASPKAENSGKKRKESPNGVNWPHESSPELWKIGGAFNQEQKTTPYSFRSRTKDPHKACSFAVEVTQNNSSKRRKVKFATTPYIYPFFGEIQTTKVVALKCLDFLSNKDIYTMSQVNNLWNQVAMDDALWE